MTTLEFQPFPKLARLNRDITITEKLDGTNAAVVIVVEAGTDLERIPENAVTAWVDPERGTSTTVYAQSRTRFITPGKNTDNYGFAAWVEKHSYELAATLGEGTHYGEWWGAGIQRGYGLTGNDKRFSLFNVDRWEALLKKNPFDQPDFDAPHNMDGIPGLGVVPVLYRGPFNEVPIWQADGTLRAFGSSAALGYDRPEGIVIYHHAARQGFKATLEGDEAPKGAAGHALDEERIAA